MADVKVAFEVGDDIRSVRGAEIRKRTHVVQVLRDGDVIAHIPYSTLHHVVRADIEPDG